jgi:hypothetical protein
LDIISKARLSSYQLKEKARGLHKRNTRSRFYGGYWGISAKRRIAKHRVLARFAPTRTTL